MWSELNNVPPAIPLIFNEIISKSRGYEDAYKRLKKLWPELRAQSRFYWENHSLASPDTNSPTELGIYLDGGLNLFNSRMGCIDIRCRLKAAKNLTRTLGLLGDTIWLTDLLTEIFLDNHKKIPETKIHRVLNDAMVLTELAPLIGAGIIKFRSPIQNFCKSCSIVFERELEEMVHDALSEHTSEFNVEKINDDAYALHTGETYAPPIIMRVYPHKNRLGAQRTPTVEESKFDVIYTAIRSALWTCNEASLGNGTVFSNSPIALAALAKREQNLTESSTLRVFDERRSIQIPWVTQLNASQIVELRDEASKALPAFRELLANHLSISHEAPSQLIGELRAQAIETRNELENIQSHSGRYWKTAYATVGLGISAYGLATDGVVPALGGLLPILHLLKEHTEGSQKELDKLHRRAGYVLVKAQGMLAHAH